MQRIRFEYLLEYRLMVSIVERDGWLVVVNISYNTEVLDAQENFCILGLKHAGSASVTLCNNQVLSAMRCMYFTYTKPNSP